MMTSPAPDSMPALLRFLRRLEDARIWYRLEHSRPPAILVFINIPGYRLEVEFFEGGEIEIERFVSTGIETFNEEMLNDMVQGWVDLDK